MLNDCPGVNTFCSCIFSTRPLCPRWTTNPGQGLKVCDHLCNRRGINYVIDVIHYVMDVTQKVG